MSNPISWLTHTTPGRITLAAGALGAGGLLLAACGEDKTPPPTSQDAEDPPLIGKLTANGFRNRDQHAILNDIHANNWPHAEAGQTLTRLENTSLSHRQAIESWRDIKYANRNPNEIVGMVQALDGQTRLWSDDITRVVADVTATGFPADQTIRFFRQREHMPTSHSQDMHDFEVMLGLRFPSWQPEFPPIVIDPYPKPVDVYPGPFDPGVSPPEPGPIFKPPYDPGVSPEPAPVGPSPDPNDSGVGNPEFE